jgi:hypothetical protein
MKSAILLWADILVCHVSYFASAHGTWGRPEADLRTPKATIHNGAFPAVVARK